MTGRSERYDGLEISWAAAFLCQGVAVTVVPTLAEEFASGNIRQRIRHVRDSDDMHRRWSHIISLCDATVGSDRCQDQDGNAIARRQIYRLMRYKHPAYEHTRLFLLVNYITFWSAYYFLSL